MKFTTYSSNFKTLISISTKTNTIFVNGNKVLQYVQNYRESLHSFVQIYMIINSKLWIEDCHCNKTDFVLTKLYKNFSKPNQTKQHNYFVLHIVQ